MSDYNLYLDIVIQAAVKAGDAIMMVYQTDFDVEKKADQSPLTLADRQSHEIIHQHLSKLKFPILSEEGRQLAYDERKKWDPLWIVDPLDGTKEFVKRNDEFTVNIALVEKQQPVLGVVYVPATGVLYYAARGLGGFRVDLNALCDLQTAYRENEAGGGRLDTLLDQSVSLPLPDLPSVYTIVGSRSHATPELEAFVEEQRRRYGVVDFVPAGSSLKICRVAEGSAHIYPRLGPTMEWDTAAGHAVATISGCEVYRHGGNKTLRYNKEDLLNPWFIVERVA